MKTLIRSNSATCEFCQLRKDEPTGVPGSDFSATSKDWDYANRTDGREMPRIVLVSR